MKFTPHYINRFLLFKLPIAWISGIRLRDISDSKAIVTAKHRWINQNPFQSMYFAVLAMGAELSTGILVMKKIHNSGKNISMLVTGTKAEFTKKAKGRIRFVCNDGQDINQYIEQTISTGEGVVFNLTSKAYDEKNDLVCTFVFHWSIKLKS
jgi:hypothetical protein